MNKWMENFDSDLLKTSVCHIFLFMVCHITKFLQSEPSITILKGNCFSSKYLSQSNHLIIYLSLMSLIICVYIFQICIIIKPPDHRW